MPDRWQAFGKIDPPTPRVVTPYWPSGASAQCPTQLADSLLCFLPRPRFCFLYSTACRIILTFLRNQDTDTPMQDEEVNNLMFTLNTVYMLRTPKHKLGHKRQREKLFHLPLSPVSTLHWRILSVHLCLPLLCVYRYKISIS